MKFSPPLLESKGMAWDYVFVVDYMTQPGKDDEIGNENENSEVMGHREVEIVSGRNKNEFELMTQDNCLVSGVLNRRFIGDFGLDSYRKKVAMILVTAVDGV